jgi:predicted metal-binding protein
MNLSTNELVTLAKSLGADHAAIAEVEKIQFNEDFRKQCEQNTCGNYNRNWMCPPTVGSITELKERALKFKQGLLFQTVYQLEDSFDWEGMIAAVEKHNQVFRTVLQDLKNRYKFKNLLPLNVGPCTFCSRCSFLDGQECRCPEEAVYSVEACGIDVIALEKSCEIPYYNGKDTVSTVSLILFEQL